MIDEHTAIKFLSEGKVVAVPTETVYGLAADAMNPAAIAKIFEIKNRPADNPLICHFCSIEQIKKYVLKIPSSTEKLLSHFSPGPISFMLDLPQNSPLKFATCGSEQVIARIPDHKLFLKIIEGLNSPVAAPSANTSGSVSPTSAIMVENDLGKKVDGIVDGGNCTVGIESTIIDTRNENQIFILRPGAIGEAEISKVFTEMKIYSGNSQEKFVIPGSKYRHYSPATPIYLIDKLEELADEKTFVLIVTDEQAVQFNPSFKKHLNEGKMKLHSLGSANDLNALAKNFYQRLAALDELKTNKAFILRFELGDSSLAKALQNRLEKILCA